MSGVPGTPCKCCNELGHRSRDCPQLSAPLRGGFSHENGTSGVDPDGGEEDSAVLSALGTCLSTAVPPASSSMPMNPRRSHCAATNPGMKPT